MPRATITVDGKPFLGRVEEQKRFRAALQEVLHNPRGEDLPYVFLLYGDGGLGKTTLAKRFRDIATQERPFAREFQILWVDWEEERSRFPALQVGRAFIRPETVFDVLYTVAQRQDWGKHFSAYRKALEARRTAEKKAAEALAATGERNEFAALRGAGATAIARILRTGLPAIGETGEKLARAFLDVGIKVGAEQAAELRARLENRLRARLSSRQFDLFVNPNEGLARALADGLKRLARKKPLLLVLDTYEIVDRADIWLRMVMQAAGPRLVWVVSGRDDLLRSRRFGDEFFQGCAHDFPRRLAPLEMSQLALADVQAYFAARVPQRPLEPEAAAAISRATLAIPLAMELAAEMWAKGVPLEDIVGEVAGATPQREIVAGMSERYLLHAVKPEDRRALFALTLARGDVEVLRARLRPDNGPFDLEALLRRLERDYASVHIAEHRLHDEPALFFRQHLKAPLRRTSDEVQGLVRRAVAALRERLARLEAGLPLLEDRCQDEDWVRAGLDLTDFLFWLGDEFFYGPFKQRMGDIKLWALVIVIIAIFASQATLSLGDMGQVALIIFVISIFFTGMFLIGLAVGKGFRLGYEDTTTLIFTTTARNSEAVIGVAVAAFPGRPLVYFAILIGPIVELPVLLLLSRLMLALRGRLWQTAPSPAAIKG